MDILSRGLHPRYINGVVGGAVATVLQCPSKFYTLAVADLHTSRDGNRHAYLSACVVCT